MTTTLSKLLHRDPANLSIKAKTNEGMGFTGQGEGIAAMVVATIKQ